MTRVRPVRWGDETAAASPPPTPLSPAEAWNPAPPPPLTSALFAPVPPPPAAPAAYRLNPPTAPAGQLPGLGWTIGITFFFGLFGLIPASMHSSRARQMGGDGGRYWKAFWLTMLVSFVLWIIVMIALFALFAAAVSTSSTYGAPRLFGPTL